MSVIGPNTPGAGVEIPISRYIAGVTDNFPRVNRNRIVEVSIAGRERIDILPVNLTSDRRLEGGYIEFRIPGITGRFLDLSKISLEVKLSLLKTGNVKLEADDYLNLVNGAGNTLFKSVQVYIGDRLVESNPFFNYSSYIKLLSTFKKSNIDTIGNLGYLFNEKKIEDTYIAASFTGGTAELKERINNLKTNGLHLNFPLMLDVSSLEQFLLDNIPVRIRLELASNNWAINTHQVTADYKLQIDDAKLWIDRIIPNTNALLSLNSSLGKGNKSVDYMFSRTLYKTYVVSANQTSHIIDLPWNQIIPDKLYLCMTDLASFSGNFNRNPLYFQHADVTNIQVQINGVPLYNISAKFPHQTAQAYYETCSALGLGYDHLLTFEGFKNGGTLFVFDFSNEQLDDIIPLEKSGNLRISLTFSSGVAHNRLILLFGESMGILNIYEDRTVMCDVRA